MVNDMDNKPNILFIITDQQSHRAMSCTGNSDLKTNGMDRIASMGTHFTAAYTNNPVCIPARISMFTGRWPHEAGIYSNTRAAPDLKNFTWLGKLVKDAGYRTIYNGKWHLVISPQNEKLHGFDECFTWSADHLHAETIDEILNARNEDGDNQPFFMVASFINPHNVCQWARGQPLPNGEIPPLPENIDELPPLPGNFTIPENEPSVLREVQGLFRKKLYPTKDWDEKKWREYLWAYYRMVELVDGEIAKIIKSFEKHGCLENTVIIFVSDHGEGMAGHHWNQKQVLYDEVSRVPLIIADGRQPKQKKYRLPVSSGIDIFRTILDYTGASPPADEIQGRSLRKIVSGSENELSRDHVITETELGTFTDIAGKHHGRPMGRMVRTQKYKYMVYSRGQPREFLVDMEADPGETENLAINPMAPELKKILQEHRIMLAEWCKETGDDFNFIIV